MITKEDYEYLKNLPNLGITPSLSNLSKQWYTSDDTLITVARMLDDYGVFPRTNHVVDFFENPRKWTKDIQDLIKEYEQEVADVLRRQPA